LSVLLSRARAREKKGDVCASNRLQLTLADSKALAFYDGDVGVMSEPVQQRGNAGSVWRDIIPVFECSVGCDQQGGAFVAAVDHFVKQVGGAGIVGEIATSSIQNKRAVRTSHIERQNLTVRMSMRRMTRLTNAFSKKWMNHKAAYALYFAHYNFCRVHSSLRVTPAMEQGITDHVWTLAELIKQ